MSELHLGKLIKTLGKKCPECMDSALQIRLRSFENKEQEYEYCPNCQYEKRIGYKEKGRRHGDKKRARPERSDGKTGW